MCGFVSVVDWARPLSNNELARLEQANLRMTARGPDSAGSWHSPCHGFAAAHRRLAIIDLSPAGHQPMHHHSGRYTIVFNGEIYNYRELKRQLEALGHHFASDSDTEVIMAAYQAWGPRCVSRFRGMFAFCIWDHTLRKLLVARDAFGIKPLYVMREGSRYWFASQVRALSRIAGQLTEDATARAGFMLWGSIPEPWTPYREIRSIPAGTWLEWDADTAGHDPVAQSVPYHPEADLMTANAQVGFGDLVRDSVSAHCIADVPVGVFLSAGKDSTTLAALVCERAEQTAPVRTVTLGFREFAGTELDEVPSAEAVARHLGTDHTTVWTSREDFLADLESIFFAMDQPSQDGINTYFVSKAARQAGLKVVLSGLGGDELLGGYPSFRQVPRWAALPAALRPIGRALRASSQAIGAIPPKLKSALEFAGSLEHAYLLRRSLFLPWEISDRLGHTTTQKALEELDTLHRLQQSCSQTSDNFSAVSAMEADWYMKHQLLRDSDWASMAHSLELRVPLVDPVLWQRTAQLCRQGEQPDKQTLVQSPRTPLPNEIVRRPKSGFATPVARWLTESAQQAKAEERGLRAWSLHVYDQWLRSAAAERQS